MNINSNNKKKKRQRKQHHHSPHDLGAILDKHVKYEFEDPDVEATMTTMVKEPYVHHVPALTGGIRYKGVHDFYTNQLVGKMPADTKIQHISRTVGKDQVVDELILRFTHDREIKFMLPGIPPTGKSVELPHVVVMKFNGYKIALEYIYWDQASLLAQVGLLDTKNLPITGVEQAKRILDLSDIINRQI